MNQTKYENRMQEIKNIIKSYEKKIAFLESLKIKAKKNGEPFAKIENNFEFVGYNTNIVKQDRSDYKIYFNNPKTFENGELYIRGYKNLDYDYKKGEYIIPNGVSQDRVIAPRYETPFYYLNFEELKKEFETTKQNLIQWLAREKEHLVEFEKVKENILKFEKEIQEQYTHIDWYDLQNTIWFTNKG